ncbi:hypothetical protein D9758_012330 [Tetrapyrgos nigripes]|uniref:Enoyl reductase (ER) domain-containing protein n=1 Tax=Tetrapyrgos nigripes TaxID=182062 RepID=A0A8H5CLX6_9AGAR|nr:hypothetical protein D9758_012330 [Tetrapyrgos nigripes]
MSEQNSLILDGPKGSFAVSKRPIPKPSTGELLVKIQAAALNPVDWKIREHDMFVTEYPAVLGSDAAGDVEEVGEGVVGWKKGDRIYFQGYYTNDQATFQQYCLIPADLAAKIPERYSYSQAATISVAFTCAAFALFAPRPIGISLNPNFDVAIKFTGQPVVVIGGSTSVGLYAIQLLHHLSFSPIIAYASSTHESYLRELGATHLIDRRAVSFSDLPSAVSNLVSKTTSSPLKLVFDAFSGYDAQKAAYTSCADGGEVITVNPDALKPEEKVNGKNIFQVVGTVHFPHTREFGTKMWKVLGKWFEDGVIVPNRAEDLPNGLQGIVDGLEKMKSGAVSCVKLVAHPQEAV